MSQNSRLTAGLLSEFDEVIYVLIKLYPHYFLIINIFKNSSYNES